MPVPLSQQHSVHETTSRETNFPHIIPRGRELIEALPLSLEDAARLGPASAAILAICGSRAISRKSAVYAESSDSTRNAAPIGSVQALTRAQGSGVLSSGPKHGPRRHSLPTLEHQPGKHLWSCERAMNMHSRDVGRLVGICRNMGHRTGAGARLNRAALPWSCRKPCRRECMRPPHLIRSHDVCTPPAAYAAAAQAGSTAAPPDVNGSYGYLPVEFAAQPHMPPGMAAAYAGYSSLHRDRPLTVSPVMVAHVCHDGFRRLRRPPGGYGGA